MSLAQDMYAVSLEQGVDAIAATGRERDGGIVYLAEGHMGTGKTSMLKMLAKKFPKNKAILFDCTTKDLGDLMIPNIKLNNEVSYVNFATNEELGLHLDQPVILCLDEYGMSNPSVKLALLGAMQERVFAGRSLHPDSIIFATTNLGAEKVGDLLPPHACNRIVRMRIRKPEHMEWVAWGVENGIDHTVLGWAKETPQLFQSFEEVPDPNDNQYIFHPKAKERTSFVTPRSLEKASHIVKKREELDSFVITSLLTGIIGDRGAQDLAAFVKLANDLPSLESIKQDPEGALVPTTPSGTCMVVYRTLGSIERSWTPAWFTYMKRLDKEAQGYFINGVRDKNYDEKRREIVVQDAGYGEWCSNNSWMFTADKV